MNKKSTYSIIINSLILIFALTQLCFAGGGDSKWDYRYTIYNKTNQEMRINNAKITTKKTFGYNTYGLSCAGRVLKPGKSTNCKKNKIKGKFNQANFEVHFYRNGDRCDFKFKTEKNKNRKSWTISKNNCN